MRILVYAPSYDANSGGCVVLHKLVHIINEETSHEAYLVPRVVEIWKFGTMRKLLSNLYRQYLVMIGRVFYKTNKDFNTPVLQRLSNLDKRDAIVVYPEITYGNPLDAKNVVRWFLHQPGHFTKCVFFQTGELYFKFNSAVRDFSLYGSRLSKNELKVIHYPIEIYKKPTNGISRKGTCYIVRKGVNKPYIHEEDAICLDGKTHSEISKILQTSRRFISYDEYTAYSIFAVMCGCESVVVPSKGINLEEWYPDKKDRYGIAYGTSNSQLEWAKKTAKLVEERIKSEHKRSVENVRNCLEEIMCFFYK
jgi:hypothetical protein